MSEHQPALIFLLLFALPAFTQAQAYQTGEKRFPAAAVVNVKKYGAVGDGSKDDTDAIQLAISDNIGKDRTLYFPDGIYLVSEPVKWVHIVGGDSLWRARITIQGQSQRGTVIRFKDNTFKRPTALISTGSNRVNNKESEDGSGNNAFNNLFFDLTIDSGTGNSGAIALDFVGTNLAGLRNVTIRSGDGEGIAGIRLKREGGGPCLFKNVTIEGFDYGVDVYTLQYSQTYEFITLRNQKKAAIRNMGNVLSLRKVYSENSYAAPVILNRNQSTGAHPGNYGMITLVDAEFTGGKNAASVSAIVNEEGVNNRRGGLYLRNIVTTGYRSAVQNRGMRVPGASVREFVSDAVLGNRQGPDADFALPVRETPEFHENDTTKWVSVKDFGASADDEYTDDTKAIQAAISSGAEVIFFPKGKYRYNIRETIVVGGNVRQLIGMQSSIDISNNTAFSDSATVRPLFRFGSGKHNVIYFERFNLSNQRKSPFAGGCFLEQATSRTLVLRDVNNDVYAKGKYFYQNTADAGKLFIENVTSITPWHFAYPQDVWARQLNPESHHVPIGTAIVSQHRGSLWILGLKTEGSRTVIQSNRGTVELLGGFLYPTRGATSKNLAAFKSADAKFKLTFVTNTYNPATNYTTMAEDTHGVHTDVVTRKQTGNRGAGSIVPLCILQND